MEKMNQLLKKVFTKEVLFYILFGVLTTVVNIGTFYLLSNIFNFEKNLSNNIAIVIAVLFAYFTNRKLVFNSTASNFKEKSIEFGKFILGRLFTMIVESGGFFLLCNILHVPELISKLLESIDFFTQFNINQISELTTKTFITVIVIILNFFISKFFAFKKTN